MTDIVISEGTVTSITNPAADIEVITVKVPGFTGPAGPTNTLSIGTVTTGDPGTAAAVTITGTAPNQVLNFTIPGGATGAATVWPISIQPTGNYTLTLNDAGHYIHMNNSADATITIPDNTSVPFVNGTVIKILSVNNGKVSFAPGTGVNIYTANGKPVNNPPVLTQKYGVITLRKSDATDWIISGQDVPNEADRNYVRSFAATDLIANGTGYLGDNTNFSLYTFNAADSPVGGGSFLTVAGNSSTTYSNDELIPIDLNRKYLLSLQVRQAASGISSYFYAGLQPYDSAGLSILPAYFMFQNNSTTTLAADLKPGDTTISLTSSTGWANSAGGNTQLRRVIVWDWVDSFGKVWPSQTYSRHVSPVDLWADGSISGNVITLRAAFDPTAWGYASGTTIPAGTSVSNGSSGGTYMYGNGMANTLAPATWTQYQSTFANGTMPVINGGRGAADYSTGFPPGTAFVKFILLANRQQSSGSAVAGSQIAIASVSFSDATYAQYQLTQVRRRQQKQLNTASYTIGVADEGTELYYSTDTSPVTITIPANASVAFPIGGWVDIGVSQTGAVTVAAAAGVRLIGPDGLNVVGGSTTLRGMYSTVRLYKYTTDNWIISGDGFNSSTDQAVANASATASANTLVIRDGGQSAGFANVVIGNSPTQTYHGTRKDYVDTQDATYRRRSVNPGGSLPSNGSYTLAAGDEGGVKYAPTGSATVNIPTNASVPLPVGYWVDISASNGGTSIIPQSGVIFIGPDGTQYNSTTGLAIRSTWGTVRIYKYAVDSWWATFGDIPTATDNAVTAATNASTASTLMKRDANGRASVADPSASTDISTKNYVDTKTWAVSSFTATGTKDTTTFLRGDNTWAVPPSAANATSTAPGLVQLAGDFGGTATAPTVTGGTHHTHTSSQISDAASAATASKVVVRDANARAQFADPSAAQDAATKNYVDTKTWTSASISDATSVSTASVIMKRDAAGRASVADPSASTDISTKNYTDTQDLSMRRPALNSQSASYTLALTDERKIVQMTGSATTLTVPANATVAFPIGTVIDVQYTGTGGLTLAPAAGVTVSGNSSNISITRNNPLFRLVKIGTDTWAGDKISLATATSTSTVNTLILRDANGRASVTDPAASTDIATKNYVDTHTPKITAATTAPSSPAVGDVWIDYS